MNFLRCLLLALMFARSLPADQVPFYLGTITAPSGSQGIYVGTLDTATGKLGPLRLAAATKNPNFLTLSPDGQFLYAAISARDASSVEAYARLPDGTLTQLNWRKAGGEAACHISVDATGHNLLVTNYGGCNLGCFQTKANGAILDMTALVSFTGTGPNPKRQTKAFGHSAYADPENKFVYACSLGSDAVWSYRFDAAHGILTPTQPPFAKVPPGSGPRHLAFGPGGKFVYVANEMGLSVSVFSRDPVTGLLTLLETAPTLPPGTPTEGATGAEIALDSTGKWLYVSTRGSDTISVFSVATDGRLALAECAPATVKIPWCFAIDPTGQWMVVTGRQDNRIAVLKIDPATGKLTPTDQAAAVGQPVCVRFAVKPGK